VFTVHYFGPAVGDIPATIVLVRLISLCNTIVQTTSILHLALTGSN
jgi:hypothetical protein